MPTTKPADTEYIEQMYDSQLKSQKETLSQNYDQAISDLDAAKQQAARQLDQNLNVTAVESQRARKNYNEVQNAYGLTSGAMAQARLAQDNQLQADLTALRSAHETADAELERERTLLGQQYAAAIAQAQAENDMEKAQALYENAKEKEAELTARQQSAAALMAQAGDFSLYQQLYGLTDEQLARLQAAFGTETASTDTAGYTGPTDSTDPTGTSAEEIAAQVGQQFYSAIGDGMDKLKGAFGSGKSSADTSAGTSADTAGSAVPATKNWAKLKSDTNYQLSKFAQSIHAEDQHDASTAGSYDAYLEKQIDQFYSQLAKTNKTLAEEVAIQLYIKYGLL